MKKNIFVILALLLFPLLTGCSSKYLKDISIEELNTKLKNNETFVLYFNDENNNIEDTLVKVLEEKNIIGYKINTSKITNDEKLELQTKIDYEKPSIVFVVDGKDPSIMSHITDKDVKKERIEANLKDMGFIK